MTARVSALWRHPVKGHGREALAAVTLTEGQAMPWDRRWAVAHELARLTEGAWAPCANFSIGAKAPALMAIHARVDEAAGRVILSHPDRPDLTFDPDRDGDARAFLDWVAPLLPPDRARPARLVRLDGRGFTDTDYPSVSLLNLASNADLATRMGADLSPLRWRCNIHLDGLEPWAESGLVGHTLRIGAAELRVREPIRRCMATTANPGTGVRDLDTLGALNSTRGAQDFGIYAEVTRGGALAVGDRIEVL
ncbi:MOSC domain-containing protein [Roseovarius ramblicola]|uniref:MOSC domain-containing protein n=1 Tax=Roseovarius ramblicola TaxID=2022336 RepID=A0ABV5I033_9RHOB